MKVKVNGKEVDIVNIATIYDLYEKYNIHNKICTVAKNSKIISKDEYSTTSLSEGDVVDIVALNCGG